MNKQQQHRVRPTVEGLEERVTPDVTDGLNNGVLTILGTSGSDRVFVTTARGQIIVTHDGTSGPQDAFNASQVKRVVFVGMGGNDLFMNRTNVSATAIGGSGNDTFVAGTGKDHLFGGGGNNVLIGFPQTKIVAGKGFNVIRRNVILSRPTNTGNGSLTSGLSGANTLNGLLGSSSTGGTPAATTPSAATPTTPPGSTGGTTGGTTTSPPSSTTTASTGASPALTPVDTGT
jgi:RTX calcium-binding nonapeptide repeat (4 copies)